MNCNFKLGMFLGLILAAAAFASPGQAQSRGFLRDPATQSIWILDDGQLTAEWKADGTFNTLTGAFNVYKRAFSPSASIINFRDQIVFPIDDRFIYAKDQNGLYTRTRLFANAGDLGCHEGPMPPFCVLVQNRFDAPGDSALTVRNEKGETHTFQSSGAGYRPYTDLENKASAITDFRTQYWNRDKSAILMEANPSRSDAFAIKIMTNESETVQEFPLPFPTAAGDHRIFPFEDSYFIIFYSEMRDNAQQVVYLLEDAFGNAPKFRSLKGFPYADPFKSEEFLGRDANTLYFKKDAEIVGLARGSGQTTRLTTCNSVTQPLENYEAIPVSTFFLGCDKRLLKLGDGSIQQEWPLSNTVDYGSVFDSRPESLDIVVTSGSGRYERIRADRENVRARLSPLEDKIRDLTVTWQFADRTCGIREIDSKTVCRSKGIWKEKDLGLGTITALRFLGGHWWAASHAAGKRNIFRLEKGAGNSRREAYAWRQIAEWPNEGDLAILRDGTEGIAVRLDGKHIERFDGTAFHEAFSHDSGSTSARPAISTDGFLYDTCAGDTSPYLCRVHADGAIESLALLAGGDYGIFTPLKRGLIYKDSTNLMVVRDTRAIPARNLYGELMTGPTSGLGVVDLGNGSVLLEQFNFFLPNVKYYSFDGSNLTFLAEVKTYPLTNQLDKPFGAPNDLPQMYQSEDGLWRVRYFGSMNLVGKAPTDTLADRNPSPDDISDAAIIGDRVVTLNRNGLWSCPLEGTYPIGPEVSLVAQTRNCRKEQDFDLAERILPLSQGGFLLKHGGVVSLVSSSRMRSHAIVSQTSRADLLGSAGSEAVWLEDRSLKSFSPKDHSVASIAIPAEVIAVKAVAKQWICAQNGVYFQSNEGDWQKASIRVNCLGMVAQGDLAYLVSDRDLYRCEAGLCKRAGTLPRSFSPDGAIGAFGAEGEPLAPVLTLADALYRWDEAAQTFDDITPRYGFGSAIIGAVTHINRSGTISIQGGGALLLEKDKAVRHVHID